MFYENKLIKNKKISILVFAFCLNINIFPILNSNTVEAKNSVLDWNSYQYTESEPKATPEMEQAIAAEKEAKEKSTQNGGNDSSTNPNLNSNPNNITGPNNPNNISGAGLNNNTPSDNNSNKNANNNSYGNNDELVRNILNDKTVDKQIDIKTLGNNNGYATTENIDPNLLASAQEECMNATGNKDVCSNEDVMKKYASCIKEYGNADACAFLLDNTIEADDSLGSLAKKALSSQEGRENLAKYLGFESWNDLVFEVGKEVALTLALSIITGGIGGVAVRALMAAKNGKKALSILESAEKIAEKGSSLESKLISKANKLSPKEITKLEDVESSIFKGTKEISTNGKGVDGIKDVISEVNSLSKELSTATDSEAQLSAAEKLIDMESTINKSSRLLEKSDFKNAPINKAKDVIDNVVEKVSNPLENKAVIVGGSAVASHELTYSNSILDNVSQINSDTKVHNDNYNEVEKNKDAIVEARDSMIKENNKNLADYKANVMDAMKVAQQNDDEQTVKALDKEFTNINKEQQKINKANTEIQENSQKQYNELSKEQQTESRYKRSIAEYIGNGFK